MSVNENAVVLRFADRATAYQALSDLKHLDSGTTEVRGAMLIERLSDGGVRVPEALGTEAGRRTAVGGLVGSLVGVLGGPLGMLMGWGVGAVIGGGRDHRRAAEAVGLVSQTVAPEDTAILVEVRETDTEALDLLAMQYDAVLERCPVESVRGELHAMEEAADRIRKDELKERRDRKRAETEGRFEARVMTLREKFAA